MTIEIPSDVLELGKVLECAGYEWVLVGGCVRDALRGVEPHDYDMATNATPDEMKAALSGFRSFETGIQHGTLTVLTGKRSVEVTTYRIDGGYSDSRHPDAVQFSSSLLDDLSRRDFTVNALAYHPEKGLVDEFGGVQDLKDGVIACVGDAATRFREDALRILRALRFASTLGFSIEFNTKNAIRSEYPLLEHISAERIWAELVKILQGKAAGEILRSYREMFFFLMPELAPMDGLDQKNPYHDKDVWEHTVSAVEHTPEDKFLRLAALFHDCGKSDTFFTDADGIGHFYGHAEKSEEKARAILNRLKVDNETKHQVLFLVEHHDRQFGGSDKALRRFAGKYGIENVRRLLLLMEADVSAQAPHVQAERIRELHRMMKILDRLEKENACLTIKDLAVDGRDVIACGITEGKEIGRILKTLLEDVLDERIPNERETLLEKIKTWKG